MFAGNRYLKKDKQTDNNGRIRFLSVVFLLLGLVLVLRLFNLQVLKGNYYVALAGSQHELYKKLFPERGSIYVMEKSFEGKNILYPLVTNQTMYLVYAVPNSIKDATSTAEKILSLLGLPDEDGAEDEFRYEPGYLESINNSSSTEEVSDRDLEIKNLLNRWIDVFNQPNRHYYPLRERVTIEKINELKEAKIEGLAWTERSYRFYTEKGIGGHLFGFWGYEGDYRKGKYGLEGYYDEMLSGQMGEIRSEKDVFGNLIAINSGDFVEKVDGADLVLTLNRAIQFKACEELKKSIDRNKATGGSIIVMEPDTGYILAMCSFPDFNPDEYFKTKDINHFNNRSIFDTYEPGSTFKVITMAGAIDSGKVNPNTYYTDTGSINYGRFNIKNFQSKVYDYINMTNVLEYSVNTGVIFAMRQMTVPLFSEYVRNFGFGALTGIELHREASGNINNLELRGEVNQATMSFGQGIAVTPIQLITAFSAIVNGGNLMKPHIISKIIKDDQVVLENSPEVIRQVISPKSSVILKGMLVSVVENGHVTKARIAGYRVGGKTGTAQVPDSHGGYKSNDSVITSFVGFAPFDNPKIAILVKIDEPQSARTGEGSAVPVFTEVAKFALQHFNIPKDKVE
jgi:stage V sporulation protein D (sporulation-specific penicillin-binding protein)